MILAPKHAAQRIGKSVSRLVQLDREGKLIAERDSAGRRFYRPEVVEAYAQKEEARQQRPEPAPAP